MNNNTFVKSFSQQLTCLQGCLKFLNDLSRFADGEAMQSIKKHLFYSVPHRVIRCYQHLRFVTLRCHCRNLNIYYYQYLIHILVNACVRACRIHIVWIISSAIHI